MQVAKKITAFAKRISHTGNFFAERSLLFLGLTMAAVVISQVFCRYIFNHSLFWSEELARYLLVWLTFLGASVAYQRDMHPGVDFLYSRMPMRFKRYSRLLIHILSLALFSVMIWYGCKFAYFVKAQTTPALSLPKWSIFSIIPISGMLLFLHATAKLLQELLFTRGK